MKKKRNTFGDYLKEELKNKTFREAFEHYRGVLEIGLQVRVLREREGLTQNEPAKRLKASQQGISRIESGEADNPTVATLERIAKATGHQLRVEFQTA